MTHRASLHSLCTRLTPSRKQPLVRYGAAKVISAAAELLAQHANSLEICLLTHIHGIGAALLSAFSETKAVLLALGACGLYPTNGTA